MTDTHPTIASVKQAYSQGGATALVSEGRRRLAGASIPARSRNAHPLAHPIWVVPARGRPGLITLWPELGKRETARLSISTAFTRMFGCAVPIQQAGMGGFTAPDLAIAVAQAGGVGMLTGTIGYEALSSQLDVIPVGMPVGVNFLVPFLDRDALEDASNRSRLVEFFWGWPEAGIVEVAHAGGALVGWQIGSADEARAARDAGCDLVIAQGIEAGGHVRGQSRAAPATR